MCEENQDCCKKPEKQEPRSSGCCGENKGGCHGDKEKNEPCCCGKPE